MTRSRLLLFHVFSIVISVNFYAQEKTKSHSHFRDSEDNAIDMSDWLINKKGALLLPTIITEPAVGYGAAGALLFFHSSYSEGNGPP
jgi:hypothetical protein